MQTWSHRDARDDTDQSAVEQQALAYSAVLHWECEIVRLREELARVEAHHITSLLALAKSVSAGVRAP